MLCSNDGSIDVGANCRTLDFTFGFEALWFGIVTSAIYSALAILQLVGSVVPRKGPREYLPLIKLLLSVTLLVTDGIALSRASPLNALFVGSSAVTLLASCLLVSNAYRHWAGFAATSLLPSIYLLLLALWDAARLRTFVLADIASDHYLLFGAFVAGYVVRLMLLVVDNIPEQSQGDTTLVERLLLWRYARLLLVGMRGRLELDGLTQTVDKSSQLHSTWQSAYDASRISRHPLALSILRAFPKLVIMPLVPALVMTGGFLTNPLQLKALLRFLESWWTPGVAPEPVSYGWALAGSFGITAIMTAVGTTTFMVAAAALLWSSEPCFAKPSTLRLHITTSQEIGSGALSSYLTVDVERVVSIAELPYRCIALLVQFALVLLIMSAELDAVVVAPTLAISLSVLLLPLIQRRFSLDSSRWSIATDRRTKLIASLLSSIKAIKLGAYEAAFAARYNDLRAAEVKEVRRYRLHYALNGYMLNIGWAAIRVTPIVAFAIYALLGGPAFTYRAVFVLLAAFECLTNAYFNVVWRYGLMVSAWSSLKRLQTFLDANERSEPDAMPSVLSSGRVIADDKREKGGPAPTIVFEGATIGYAGQPVLLDLTATCPAGQLTMILGCVACGKTSFLNAVLGEIDVQTGSIRHEPSRRLKIAYCSQDPVLFAGSIRDNILLGFDYEQTRYREAVASAALTSDLDELEDGDRHPAESLSGGQRHRVALARAIYEDAEVVVLDDVLSAVDHMTEAILFESLFDRHRGVFVGKTCIMTSNDIKRLRFADHLVHLEHGRIAYSGPPAAFYQTAADTTNETSSTSVPEARDADQQGKMVAGGEKADRVVGDEAADTSLEGTASVFWHHLRLADLKWNVVVFLSIPIWTFIFISGYFLYCKYWTRSPTALSAIGAWIGGFFAITLVNLLFGGTYFMVGQVQHPLSAFRRLHQNVLAGTLSAPISFFASRSHSFIVNRFNSDVLVCETEFLLSFLQMINTSVMTIWPIVFVVIAVPWTALVMLVVFAIAFGARAIYMPTSKQLRALESSSKTPLYSVTAQISNPEGLKLVRAFRRQTQMIARASECVPGTTAGHRLTLRAAQSRKQTPVEAYFSLLVLRQVMFLLLYTATAPISVALVAIAVSHRTEDQGLFAIALLSAIWLPAAVGSVVFQITEAEIGSVAIARQRWLANAPREEQGADMTRPLVQDDLQWLKRGDITFERVSMRYRQDLPLVVRDVSFTVAAGSRLGICGRTGSGKTTLLSLLFRLADVEHGSITVDGRDITSMPRQQLRSALCAIPQDPLLVDLPLRDNLDPWGRCSDAELWSALERTQCKHFVERLEGQLDHEVVVNGGAFSRGMRQLIALTRALLQKPKILALDEASSSLDVDTDNAIQETLRSGFGRETTLLVVAHRISTIRDMDLIICMDKGRIVEKGPPDQLLKRPDGVFRNFAGEG